MILKAERLRPLGKLVLAKAIEQERTEGGLWIPLEARERYPNIGRVKSVGARCMEDIRWGDIAIFSTEMFDASYTNLDCFQVILRDKDEDVRILVDIDVEPIFKEQMELFKANPSTEDRWFTLKNMEDDLGYKFLASDVLDFGPAQLQASSIQKLRYVEARMFNFLDEEGENHLYYLVDERYIQGIIRIGEEE